MRIIVLLKRSLLWIEQGYCIGTRDKKYPGIKWIGNKASYPFGFMEDFLDHLQQFNRNCRESCLVGKYLQSIGSNCVDQQWRSLLKQKIFKQAGTLNSLETLYTILEEHWKSICQASYLRNKVNVSHSSVDDHMQVGTMCKAIFSKYSSRVTILSLLDRVFTIVNWDLCHWKWMMSYHHCIFSFPSVPLQHLLQQKLLELLNCQLYQYSCDGDLGKE